MTESQRARWDRLKSGPQGSEHLAFDRVSVKRSGRPDLHAFLLLDELFPQSSNIVDMAEHDQIWLDIDLDQIESLSAEQVLELIRCGIQFDVDTLYKNV